MGQIIQSEERREYLPSNPVAVVALSLICLVLFACIMALLVSDETHPQRRAWGLGAGVIGCVLSVFLLLFGLIYRSSIVFDARTKMVTVTDQVGPFKWEKVHEFHRVERIEYFPISNYNYASAPTNFAVAVRIRIGDASKRIQLANFFTFSGGTLDQAQLEAASLGKLVGCPVVQTTLGAGPYDPPAG